MTATDPRSERTAPPSEWTGPRSRTARPRTFESLRDPNFRLFFLAQFGSFTAMNVQMFIRGWLVFELTGSYKALGVMSLANGLSGLILAPLGGVIADRVRQKKHMVQIDQAINALLALTVGVLIASGELVFWHLVAAAVIQGGAMNAMMPARQAMTPDVVGMERLTNAIALNTSGMNAARLLMPGIAGFVVAALGGGDGYIAPAQWVYFANVFLYGWAMVGVGLVRVPDKPNVRPRVPGKIAFLVDETRSGWRELKLGARYVWNTPTIRLLLACNFLMVFFSMTYFMLLPGFAKDVLDTGPFRLGLLTSISGVGSLAGSLVIASLPDRRRGLILLSSSLVLGIALIAFSASTTYWLSAGLLVLVGIGQSGRMSLSNVLVQSNTADEFRGRVMSIYMMEFSLMSIGIYFVGMLANYFGPQIAVGGSAVGLVIMSLLLLIFVPTYRNLQ